MNPNDFVGILGSLGILLAALGTYLKTRADAKKAQLTAESAYEESRYKLDSERTALAMTTVKAANETIEILKTRLQIAETHRDELYKRFHECEEERDRLSDQLTEQKTRPLRRRITDKKMPPGDIPGGE